MSQKTPISEATMAATWPLWYITYQRLNSPPWEIMEWLCDFRAALYGGLETFERHITSGGLAIEIPSTVDNSDNCNASIFEGTFEGTDDPHVWLHANHRLYNRMCRRMIGYTIGICTFREILVRDLAVVDSDLGPEWGRLLRKDYAKEIIENFVNSTKWC